MAADTNLPGLAFKPRKHFFTPSDDDRDTCLLCGHNFRNANMHCMGDERPETDAQYIERLESALRAASAPDGVVAWQWRHTDPISGNPIWNDRQFWNGHRSDERRPLYAAPQSFTSGHIAGQREMQKHAARCLTDLADVLEKTGSAYHRPQAEALRERASAIASLPVSAGEINSVQGAEPITSVQDSRCLHQVGRTGGANPPTEANVNPLAGKIACRCYTEADRRLCLEEDRCYRIEAQGTNDGPSGPSPAPVGDVGELRLLIDEYNPRESDWSFRKGVIHGLIDKIAALSAVAWRTPVETVADLVNNLLTLDQSMNVHTAYFITHADGRREARTRSPSLSREHVADNRIRTRDETIPYSLVIWASQDQRPDTTPATSRDRLAREALEPLAEMADGIPLSVPDEFELLIKIDATPVARCTVGQVRRARAALQALGGSHE